MKTRFHIGAIALVFLIGGCWIEETSPFGPEEGLPEAEFFDTGVWTTPLLRDKPVTEDVVESFTVGPRGGEFELPFAGLHVAVPSGAVSEPLTISVRVIAGDLVAYDFAPHGTTFDQPLEIQQSLKGTNWYKLDRTAQLEAAYFGDVEQLDHVTKQAQVTELLPVRVQVRTASVRFLVTHFSGYLVSSGRTARPGRES
jgi:hypothetical protein